MDLVITASGRVLLAFAEEEFTERTLVEASQVTHVAGTDFDLDTSRLTLTEIWEKGYAINKTAIEEATAAAAPIVNFVYIPTYQDVFCVSL